MNREKQQDRHVLGECVDCGHRGADFLVDVPCPACGSARWMACDPDVSGLSGIAAMLSNMGVPVPTCAVKARH